MSLETMGRVIECATAKEIDFLLYTMRFQDNLGVIRGITRAEICSAINIHKSKFYAMITSLEEKGIIRVLWSEKRHGFWTILVIGNSFVGRADYKKGYINLNTAFLWSFEFLGLTKTEKVICLKILALYRDGRKKISLNFKTLMGWTGCRLQTIKKHIMSIMNIFDIYVNESIVTIDAISCYDAFSRNFKSESDTRNEHLLNYMLSVKGLKNQGEGEEGEKSETLAIFKTFGDRYGECTVVSAVLKCLDNYGVLIPKYINKLTQIIYKNKSLVELFY